MSLFLGNTQIGGVATGDAATIENLNPEISTQDNLIAQIMGALEGKIAPPDLSAKVSELEAEVENLEETNSNLSSQVSNLEETNNDLFNQISNLEETNSNLSSQNSQYLEQLNQLTIQINKLNASWAGTLTFSGAYATSTYYTKSGCSIAIDKQKGMAFIIIQGGTSTSYENIYFNATSLPSGVTLLTPPSDTNFGTGGSTKRYYTAVLTGITGKINVAVAMGTRASTNYDAVRCDLTVTYAQ